MGILKQSLMMTMAVALLAGCTKEDKVDGTTAILFTSSFNQSGKVQSNVVLEDFIVNISEIELEYDEDDDLYGDDDVYQDVELMGPFTLNLMDNGATLTQPLANIDLPAGLYDEIEFEFEKSRQADSPILGKSIQISGTINSIPFVFFTDEEYEVEVEFENGQTLTITQLEDVVLQIEFDLTGLFGANSGAVNLNNAQDGNNDGLIEIHANDPDGNQALAEQIEDLLDDIIYSYED